MKMMMKMKYVTERMMTKVAGWGKVQDPGIDGILVTVGLCVIALLLCVVMKDSLSGFITTIMDQLTVEAQKILSGVGA